MNRAEGTPASTAAADTDPAAELRAARESLNMTVDDVAEALHLDVDIVAALDRGELDSLGAAVFVKGYLRGYARLVGLDEERIVSGYAPAQPDPEEFRQVSRQREVKSGRSLPLAAALGFIGLLVLAGVVYVISGDSPETPQPARDFIEEPAPAPAAQTPVPVAPADPSPGDDFVVEEPDTSTTAAQDVAGPAEPAAATPAPELARETPPPPVAEVAPAPEVVQLELSFSAECWVELADARQRLLYGLEKAGSRRTFEAVLPLRFYLGDASAVQIRVADADYRIPAGVRTGRKTARFMVRADDLPASR